MKYIKLSFLMFSTALLATPEVTTLAEVFSEAKTSGNIKYYYIQTDKKFANTADTSANAHSVGGQLKFDTASLNGFSGGATFMTTNPFLLNTHVDTSIIGRDNGVRLGSGASGSDAQKGFSVLGEVYLAYTFSDFTLKLGREVLKTPLIDAKEVRMLPSAVEGMFGRYLGLNKKLKVEVEYLTKFKQRTSDTFTNIVEHALGSKTKAVTGSDTGYILMGGLEYKNDLYSVKGYDYYAKDFLYSLYVDGSYKLKLADTITTLSAQYIFQTSIGNADKNLAQVGSLTGEKNINANAFGFKAETSLANSKFLVAYTKVLKDDNKHDSLVLPWDGTPLYSDMITSNNLFQSNYGKSLNADGNYIGGSAGIKIAYLQKYDGFGLEGISTNFSYLNISNARFTKNQHDYNAVIAYKYDKKLSVAVKGIWVKNNTSATEVGNITQLQQLSQYRVIANYKF